MDNPVDKDSYFFKTKIFTSLKISEKLFKRISQFLHIIYKNFMHDNYKLA